MSLWTNVSRAATALRNRVGKALISEAAGALIDNDDPLFQPLTQSADQLNDLIPYEMTKQRRIARTNYFRGAVGGALPDMMTARVLGSEAAFKAADGDAVQPIVDRFITDPYNDINGTLHRFVTELQVFGELFLPIYLTKENADVRLGYLLPDQVESVIWETGNAKRAVAFVQKRPKAAANKLLWVIPHPDPAHENHFPPHPALTEGDEPGPVETGKDGMPVILPVGADGSVMPEIRKILDEQGADVGGYAFYTRTNCLVSGRGRSCYERINDWIRGLDDWGFGILRNAVLQGAFVWSVLIEGATEPEIEARKTKFRKETLGGSPRPGSVLFHNEKEKWEALSPSLPAASAIKEIMTSVLKIIGLALGFPGHEMGAEDNSNRSTAKEASTIATNRGKKFQAEVVAMLLLWIAYQIDQKVYAKQLDAGVDRRVECVLAELEPEGEDVLATAIQAAALGLMPLVAQELVLKRDAITYLYNLMGIDVPAPEYFDTKIAEQRAKAPPDGTADGGSGQLKGIIDQINATVTKKKAPAPDPRDVQDEVSN